METPSARWAKESGEHLDFSQKKYVRHACQRTNQIRVVTGSMSCTLAVIGQQQSRRPPLAAAARALTARSQEEEQGKASLQLSSTQRYAPVAIHPRCTMASCVYRNLQSVTARVDGR